MARTCRSRPHPARDLDALARQLDAIAEDAGWGAAPLLIGLTADGPADVGPPTPVRGSFGTDPDDLVASLVGFDAPDDWEAMAVVVQGRSWALDDHTEDPRPVRLTHVVDRTGGAASVVRQAGEEPVVRTEDGHGRLVDVCRRALGLPTAPPPPVSTALWALLWLDALLARAATGEAVAHVDDAVLLHPGVTMVADQDPELLEETVDRIVRVGEILGEARPWSRLRRAAATGAWPVEGLSPEGAAWMDDGMFARWLLAGFPTVDEYLGELGRLLPEPVVDDVADVLAAWDLGAAGA